MRIKEVEVIVAGLALREPLRSADLVHHDKSTLFLRVTTDVGVGWGECVAYPGARDPDPTVEHVEQAVDAVAQRLWVATLRGEAGSALDAGPGCAPHSVKEQTVAA
ncbi:MAG TPA: hypothetical protein VEJ44_04740, partial [Acidimicrobiales bacterium]|nr:hypothetical protein [Acidimicrobiales bacterium]